MALMSSFGASGLNAPRDTAPLVASKTSSRYVVTSVVSVHLIFTDPVNGVSGSRYETTGFVLPMLNAV